MYLLTVLLSLVCFSLADVVTEPEPDSPLTGPKNVTIKEFPFQASVQGYSLRLCGAVIVSPVHLVTTKNCLRLEGYAGMRVRVGSSSRNQDGILHEINGYKLVNPPVINTSLLYDLDIAVITLSSPIEFGDNVQAIAMVPEGEDEKEGMATMLGWEWIGPTRNTVPDENFQKLRLPLVDRQQCIEVYKKNFTVTENMICAGGAPSSVLRQQNGNGGALINDKNQLIGVLSFADRNHTLGLPYVFTRIGSPDVQALIKNWTSTNALNEQGEQGRATVAPGKQS